jgi:predicted TIM-barrel fold metal-dependent hydrolase
VFFVQYYYGNKTPLSVLDEIEFWKHQEGEHTVVIRQIAGNLEENFVEELKEWEQAFAQTEAVAVRYIEAVIRSKREISPALLENIRKFTVYAKNQSLSFVAFLNQLAAESEAIRNNPVAGVVINHIRRESEYLIGIITAALNYF